MATKQKKEVNYQERVLDEVKESLNLLGNKIICDIFENYLDSPKELYFKLREYNNGLTQTLREFEESKDEEDENGVKIIGPRVHSFIYLNGVCLDAKNIGRIEFFESYNTKRNRMDYFLLIYKKYPSPNEEYFMIPFSSEENRDLGFDQLRAKLKICEIQIF
jgi:hypothetical protein